MKQLQFEAVVIGAGAAGLAAAATMADLGHHIAVIEREPTPGGILNQCIHNGFGLHYFEKDLTGPEYAHEFQKQVLESNLVDLFTGTTVMHLEEQGDLRVVLAFSSATGILRILTKTIILSMGCRERNRGSINIPGTRPAGIMTAGLAQRLVNIDGLLPGKRVVIVGSGDIGLIMARRMVWSGAEVLGVVEIQPYPSGLTRNIVQCLNDFQIPLHLSHTVSKIYGKDRVEAVDIVPVDIPSDPVRISCDTLLLSVGLVPDNELSKAFGILLNHETGGPVVDATLMTSRRGVFACGNVLHVHDLVDNVSEEAKRCAHFASAFLKDRLPQAQIPVTAGANVRYVTPGSVIAEGSNTLYLRSMIVKNSVALTITLGTEILYTKRLSHVQPSEMIGLELTAEIMEKIGQQSAAIEVSIQ